MRARRIGKAIQSFITAVTAGRGRIVMGDEVMEGRVVQNEAGPFAGFILRRAEDEECFHSRRGFIETCRLTETVPSHAISNSTQRPCLCLTARMAPDGA